ncbi:MAG TPA: HEPN domain-containing protein [Epulopiscium sp.]|nr:HEPN domain-containing protein [Candidatus Epulonipiscium sp.]
MSSYLHLAKADLKYAHFGLTQGNDEVDINYAAYHVHQAIEKITKGLLELQGEDMARRRYRTHDIGFLLSCLPSEVYIPSIISERTFEIIRWVSEPRYNVNFRLPRGGVYEVYAETLHWLETIIPPVQGEALQKPYLKKTTTQKNDEEKLANTDLSDEDSFEENTSHQYTPKQYAPKHPSSNKHSAANNTVGKHFPKKKDTGKGSSPPGAYKRKKKKKKPRA